MGKVDKLRKYRSQWEKELWAKGWLCKGDPSLFQEAYCKVCKSALRAHCTDLKKHTTTDMHIKRMKALTTPVASTLHNSFIINISNEQKERDFLLAGYIAMHSAVNSIDHLNSIIKIIGKGTTLEQTKIHRTKCSALLKSVIGPVLLEELIQDINGNVFSLIVDESTDISVNKYLCLCIKYYSESNQKILTDFLGIIEVERVTAQSLYTSVVDSLKLVNLNIKQLIAIGTDGANNLCGRNHSLFTLLKETVPNLQIVRCVCHSINNASAKASEQLPAHLDFLCKEIYNWFSDSSLRKIEFSNIYKLINNDKESHQFVQLSSTRWLARYNVINIILENWIELKCYFNNFIKNDKDYTARLLNEMLNDHSNYLLLRIISPVLYIVNTLNLSFQKNYVDLGDSYDDICAAMLTLAKKVIKLPFLDKFETLIKNLDNDLAFLNASDGDYGVDYYRELANLKISVEERRQIENRAFLYIKALLIELKKRLPDSLTLFRHLKMFSVKVCLDKHRRSKFKDLPFVQTYIKQEDMGRLEIQWEHLCQVNWQLCGDNDQPIDSHQFWGQQVMHYTNAGGEYVFKELAHFVLMLLSFPSSNAVVERVFSVMNAVKTKARNRLKTDMLSAILRLRIHLHTMGICCEKFTPSPKMYQKFNNSMYNSKTEEQLGESSENGDNNVEFLICERENDIPCLSIN